MFYLAGVFLALSLLVINVAWAAPAAIGEIAARHLLERTGFGAPPAEVKEWAKFSREQAVDRLLADNHQIAISTPPDIPYERPNKLKNLSEEERKDFQRQLMQQGMAIRSWWVGEMLNAAQPADALAERMTLFWHNHFVTSQQKVKSGYLMLRQNALLRRYALGNFASLLHAVAKDPAMVIYLDVATNRKASPNENFAREVMELFTLGEGHYSERDVKEAARAFTGWSFDPESGAFLWRPGIHDETEKTVLGHTGNLDGDAVLDILLNQPSTAEFIVSKLWREFVSPTPDAAEVRRIAASFRGHGYEIWAVLKPLLLSDAFWSSANRGVLIKSPVDFVIGSLRTLEVKPPELLPVAAYLRQLGQDLFAPPNVRGWPGGESWLNSSTLLARKQMIERLLQSEQNPLPRARIEMRFDSQRWLQRYPDSAAVQRALLPLAPAQAPADGITGLPLLRAILFDPTYQLK